jgi:two-component system nitrate/nitrite response regulator NarL
MVKPTTVFKVVIVDDNESFSKALVSFFKLYPFMNVLKVYRNGKELIDDIDQVVPDIIFMDIVMPVMDGIDATRIAMKRQPNVKIIAVSMHDDGPNVKRMLQAGAWSYITKDITKKTFKELMDSLINNKRYISPAAAVKYTLHTNRRKKNEQDSADVLPESTLTEKDIRDIPITPAEKKIMGFIVKGYSHKQIADEMSRSPRTVDTHKQNLMNKFNIHKTSEMVALMVKHNLL